MRILKTVHVFCDANVVLVCVCYLIVCELLSESAWNIKRTYDGSPEHSVFPNDIPKQSGPETFLVITFLCFYASQWFSQGGVFVGQTHMFGEVS